MRLKIIPLIILVIQAAIAKDLGTYGPVFEIAEESLLTVIQKRLMDLKETDKLEVLQRDLQEKASQKIQRPTPVEGITRTTFSSKRSFDPSFVVSKDIKDHTGRIIALAGTSYNPLDTVSFGDPLIFIDGDDESQVQWTLPQKAKIILTNGAPLDLEKLHNRPFFFDQGSVLAEKLSITEVPSLVSQEGKQLMIESVPVSGGIRNE